MNTLDKSQLSDNNFFLNKSANVYLVLFLILLFAFALRYYGFHHEHLHTFDESAYAQLGLQLSQDITDYNTQQIYKSSLAKGRTLPWQYNTPLFCHPPLFSFMISIIYRLLPPDFELAHWVSFWFGIFSIVATFFLARRLFHDDRIALFSAFLLSIDANHVICSEKIWLNTTEAFFVTVSLIFFALFLQNQKRSFAMLCGFFAGLAMLTKFTGILILISFFFYAVFVAPRHIKKFKFWLILICSFLTYAPWLLWEYKIYGRQLVSFNTFYVYGLNKVIEYLPVLLGLILFAVLFKLLIAKNAMNCSKSNLKVITAVLIFAGISSLFFYPSKFFSAFGIFNLKYIPINGWMDMGHGANWNFHFQRYIELCPLFIFAYLSFFLYRRNTEAFQLLGILLLLTFLFYFAWGSFHMRYLVTLDGIMAILTSFFVFSLWDWMVQQRAKRFIFYKICLIFFVCFFLVKTFFVTILLALPNRTCYY
ncbi:glycosyltransferase family 39 protein [Candidatus Omnitrophota bacterium]